MSSANPMSDSRTSNILTIDVEDWIQSVFDVDAPLTDHFVANTHMVLEHLATRGVHATFFVLGLAAEKAPQLVREIQAAGHEIQSHGYGHRLVTTQTPAQFKSDVSRSMRVLEDITGGAIVGYRAPAFSIGADNLWALDVLADCGMQFDASLCPVRTPRYGLPGIPRVPHRLRTPTGYSLMEFPTATRRFAGRVLPAGGGGYARLWPYALLRGTVEQLNRADAPAVLYMHPYEYNPGELSDLPVSIPWRTRLHQTLGRRKLRARMDRLLTEFRFCTVKAWLAARSTVLEFDVSELRPDPHRSAPEPVAALSHP